MMKLINIQKIKLVSLAFLFIFGTHTLNSRAAVMVSHKDKFQFDENGVYQRHFTVTNPSYLRGTVSSSELLSQVVIKDEKGEILKQFLPFKSQVSDIYFYAQTSGKYTLNVKGEIDASGELLIREKKVIALNQPKVVILSPRIRQLKKLIGTGASLDDFWLDLKREGTPLIEPIAPHNADDPMGKSVLTFVWRGAKANVRLLGGPVSEHLNLTRLENTDLWYISFTVPNTTILSYQLAPDVPIFEGDYQEKRRAILATAQRDPFNLNAWLYHPNLDKYSIWSTVRLSAAKRERWLEEEPDDKGEMENVQLMSQKLNNSREAVIYRSSGLTADEAPEAFLVVFDGDRYIRQGQMPKMLDNLFAAGKIPSVKVLFINNPSPQARSKELACNPEFSKALVEEWLPTLSKRENLTAQAKNTILVGSSYGGLISACTSLLYPEKFGGILSLSGSFWWKSSRDDPSMPKSNSYTQIN